MIALTSHSTLQTNLGDHTFTTNVMLCMALNNLVPESFPRGATHTVHFIVVAQHCEVWTGHHN